MTAAMTHRERVRTALNHQEPDRVPIDLSGAVGDAINVVAYRNLLGHLGMPDRTVTVGEKAGQKAKVDEDILQRFDVDFRKVSLGRPDGFTEKPLPNDSFRDEWGIIFQRPPGGYYYDVIPEGHPLRDVDTVAGLDARRWPDPLDAGRFRGLRDRARWLREETDFAVVLDVNCSFFLRCGVLRGWENFFMDLAGNQPFAEALMDRYLDFKLGVARRALEEAGEFADVVVCSSDDFGSTESTLISPGLFRALIKPRVRRTLDLIRAYTSARRFFHSDGAIYPLIGDLIDCGVEVLNPIQVSAAGMGDTRRLKAEFGDRLTFWGAVDTHDVLPRGTPAEVRGEVRRRLADLGPGGGYVLGSVHNIQRDVPPENVVAMFQAAQEHGKYPMSPAVVALG